jgi:DNA-directed RNA polymerase subunit N (RpoN/RPB10)
VSEARSASQLAQEHTVYSKSMCNDEANCELLLHSFMDMNPEKMLTCLGVDRISMCRRAFLPNKRGCAKTKTAGV